MEQIAKSAQGALMTVTVCAAKINVLKLIEAARAGEAVVIVKGTEAGCEADAPRRSRFGLVFSKKKLSEPVRTFSN
ncbi:type II toxin-antitoxin system Phd/YefM family antitoxin [Rhizobium yanglingense]